MNRVTLQPKGYLQIQSFDRLSKLIQKLDLVEK
jgi:hypothetical protein